MNSGGPQLRRQKRYERHAEAIIERATGEKVSASTVDLSGGGMLLRVEKEPGLQVGETVTCGVRLYAEKPPQSWGTGRVVRVENSLVAIDFQNGTPPPNSDYRDSKA